MNKENKKENYNTNKTVNSKQQKIVTELGNEFSNDFDNSIGQVGLSPITGGLITRNLIKEAEELLMNKEQNPPK